MMRVSYLRVCSRAHGRPEAREGGGGGAMPLDGQIVTVRRGGHQRERALPITKKKQQKNTHVAHAAQDKDGAGIRSSDDLGAGRAAGDGRDLQPRIDAEDGMRPALAHVPQPHGAVGAASHKHLVAALAGGPRRGP